MTRATATASAPDRSTQPIDINKQMSELILISGQLADTLERENDVLVNYDRGTFAALLEEKTRLSRVYEAHMISLAGNKEEDFADADPDLRDQLRTLVEEVHALIDRNARLLKIAIEANRRVVDMIAEAVKASVPRAAAYGAHGAAAITARGGPPAAALSLDRSL